MSRIRPFRGILYNPDKVPGLKEVITPPYDVISPDEQEGYYERHPQNMIRLELGKIYSDDTEQNNRYTRAGESFRSWLDAGILKQDRDPAFYVTEIDFEIDGEVLTRFEFIVLVRLERFETGGVRPHEKTFSGVKADRLKLMEQCKSNFSPIFSLFSDPGGRIVDLLEAAAKQTAPDLAFTDIKGYGHRLWRVTDKAIHEEVDRNLTDLPLYIADGHHRYETALNYRDLLVSRGAEIGPDSLCNFVMMSLSSMQDAGVAIRPVHRLVCAADQEAVTTFIDSAGSYFDMETLPFDEGNREEVQKSFLDKLKAGVDRRLIGVALRDHKAFYLLQAREEVMEQVFGRAVPIPLKKLDVILVTKLVLEGVMGLNGGALDDERQILFKSQAKEALDAVHKGECPLAVIVNPTRLEQVREVSEAGLIMPRKSTYFYPKVMTGLVLNLLE
jgi:uncharacterized protein (DUF1015 family)